MTDERRLTIGSTARLSPEDVARHTFGTGRRGFEPSEVRAFLETVAKALHAASAREHELLDALKEAEQRAAHPVLDEDTLTTALGQETAKVLRSAHDAAAELFAKAEVDAARVRAHAQEESDQLRARAEQHTAERAAKADSAAAEVHRRAQEEASARIESAKLEAEAMVSQARSECRHMVQEAQELRARVLSDLTRRRRVLHTQIEQLRAGRERLAETISEVRHTVDRVTDDLLRAEDEARSAAEAAGRQMAASEGPNEAEETSPPPSSVAVVASPAAPSVAETPVAETPVAEAPADIAGGVNEEDRRQAVEDLFARLRAEQGPLDEGVTVLGPVPPSGGAAEASQATAGMVTIVRTQEEVLVVDTDPGPGEATAVSDTAEVPVVEEQAAVDPLVARRNELLGPVVTALARRIKRAMADDQNAILDRLRAEGSWRDELLGTEQEHQRVYAEAAEAQLSEASRTGAAFAGSTGGSAPSVEVAAADLASAIVAPLRRRLLDGGSSVADGDEAALAEHVGAAFREWKGQRTERVAADHAHGAFWRSVMAVAPTGEKWRWMADDDGVECPDCDDNALAGTLAVGEAFPTGHQHPPAHPGCRCLLVPEQTS